MPWQTGDKTMDSLLDAADALIYSRAFDSEWLGRTLSMADSMGSKSRVATMRAGALFARMMKESIINDDGIAHTRDTVTMNKLNPRTHAYLRARLQLLHSQTEPDLEQKTDILFGILPDFVDASDSMRVVETLYEINNAYGKVWDTETQIDYMHEIYRYVPDSLPELKALVKSNVVRMQRTRTDSLSYLRSLDSIRDDKKLMSLAPALGVLVFSDLYRLRGNKADLDTARTFMEKLELRHDSERVYYIQLMSRHISEGNLPAASETANQIASRITDEDTPIDMESLTALIEYFSLVGEREIADSLSRRLRSAQRSADAFERAIKLSRLNADRRIADFRRYNDEVHKHQNATSVWITIGVILLIMIPSVVYTIRVIKKRQRESDARLKNDLDLTRRKLTVAEMRSAEKDRALSELIHDIDSLPADPEARADAIRKRMKLTLSGNDEWERFTAVFTEMRPGFVENLKKNYPQLTSGDVRLCCLLEMGLDTKHMAQLLMIRPESVKKHRQRLRAKLGITPEVQWSDFFANL